MHDKRHRPERATRYRLEQQGTASAIAHTGASTGSELARFSTDESDVFLEFGILAHCFVRLRCSECGGVRLLAFRRQLQWVRHLVQRVPKRRLADGARVDADAGHCGGSLTRTFGSASIPKMQPYRLVLHGVCRCRVVVLPLSVEAGAPTQDEPYGSWC